MWILETAAVALAMFSAIPVKQPVWSEKNMRYALCAFPLVGLVCAALWWAWLAVCRLLGLPDLLRAGGLCLLPVLVTGGIHLDGYADTCDTLASCAEPVKKRQILADPHCGAFAVIRLCTYFIAYFALCAALPVDGKTLSCMGLGFVLERTLSGFGVAAFPLAKDTGLAHTFATAADRRRVKNILTGLAVLLSALLLRQGGWTGAAVLLAQMLALWRYYRVAMHQFGGISGDLAGWFLQKAELWALAALVLGRTMEGFL